MSEASIVLPGQIDPQGFIPEQPATQGLTWLSAFALLEISGPDSKRFLQGQLTCDMTSLKADRWTLGACCTAKGRMVANFVIARHGDSVWLRLPRAQVSALRQHLARYAVFFKVTMTEHLDDWLVTADVPAELSAYDDNPDSLSDGRLLQHDSSDNSLTLHWPDGRVEYWLPAEKANAQLQQAPELTAEQQWWLGDIAEGIVWVEEASREAWVPQFIDWHIHEGISFRKGCYTGQEIVARLQYLGKSKKNLVAVSTVADANIAIMTALQDSQGKTLGDIAAWCGRLGLAVMNSDWPESGIKAGEIPVTLARLSYTEGTTEQNNSDADPAITDN